MPKYITILPVLCIIFVATFALSVKAQVTITLTDTTPKKFIGTSIYVLQDAENKLTLEQILKPEYDNKFVRYDKDVPNFGNVSITVWNKFTIVNHSTKSWVLTQLNDIDRLTFFYKNEAGDYKPILSGTAIPLSARKYKTNVFAFDLPVRQGDSAVFYLKVQTRNCEYPLLISDHETFVKDQVETIFMKGVYYGFVLLIIIYNTALFIAIRDRAYFYYIIYVLFTALLMAVLSGMYPFILGDRFHFLWDSGPTVTAIGGIFLFLFAKSFLKLKERAPFIFKVINYVFIPILVLNILLNMFNQSLIASVSNQIVGLLGLIVMAATAVYVYIRGFKAARFYILACSFYFAGVVLYVLKAFTLLPYNYLTTNSIEIGSALEMMLFSVSMGDRINIYRRDKSRAQQELIQSLQEKTKMQHEMLELEAKALRSQMDPHFIFNCMNSIKSLIQQKEEDKAISYLTTFSKLLRTILQNSDKREITLYDEVETCKLYTQLESLRFGNKFSYEFKIDDAIDLKSIQVPALILQPFIENAIWHGIMPREEGGFINIGIEKKDEAIRCTIDDNGIGRQLSLKSKFKYEPSTHQSKGVKLTQSRLDLDNALNNRRATVRTIDKTDKLGNAAGTTVILTFKEY